MRMPCATAPRPDTGLYNAKLGLWLFLAAEAMFFGALFSSYAFLRTAAEAWPNGAEVLPLAPALTATALLLFAATASARAWSSLKFQGTRPAAWFCATAVTGVAAAACIGGAMAMEYAEGMAPATNTFYACWYLITGLLATHAVCGCLYALYLIWPTESADADSRLRVQQRAECLGLFWQFVALAWLAAFACFHTG